MLIDNEDAYPMTNYSVLQNNVMLGLETEEGRAAFMWASSVRTADRYLYKAERFAHEVEALLPITAHMVDLASGPHSLSQTKKNYLVKFIMDRHTFNRFEGHKTGWID